MSPSPNTPTITVLVVYHHLSLITPHPPTAAQAVVVRTPRSPPRSCSWCMKMMIPSTNTTIIIIIIIITTIAVTITTGTILVSLTQHSTPTPIPTHTTHACTKLPSTNRTSTAAVTVTTAAPLCRHPIDRRGLNVSSVGRATMTDSGTTWRCVGRPPPVGLRMRSSSAVSAIKLSRLGRALRSTTLRAR